MSPFATAEEAWLWTMPQLRLHGREARPQERPGITPDQVLKCLDQLYRQRRIDLSHVRILRIWGERGMAPCPRQPLEREDARLWGIVMPMLGERLAVYGIVRRAAA